MMLQLSDQVDHNGKIHKQQSNPHGGDPLNDLVDFERNKEAGRDHR